MGARCVLIADLPEPRNGAPQWLDGGASFLKSAKGNPVVSGDRCARSPRYHDPVEFTKKDAGFDD
jgi:hypothetical protein